MKFALLWLAGLLAAANGAEFGRRLRLQSSSESQGSLTSSSSGASTFASSARLTASTSSSSTKQLQQTARLTADACPPGRLFEPCECNEVRLAWYI